MTPAAAAADTTAQARRLLDDESPLPAGLDQAAALALAWALKAQCYEAWNSAPARAQRAAACLGMLAAQAQSGQPGQHTEIQALADWTGGIAQLSQGRLAEALASLDRAATGLRQVGQPDPAAQTQVPKIMALSMLGRHDQAAACGQATQRELLALGNRSAAARVSLNLGNMLGRRDLYRQAMLHFREAAVLFARLGDHAHSVLADIGLAAALTSNGDTDEALRIHARARMRASHQGLELPLALLDESLALLDLTRGHYRQALAGLESARRRYAALAMPQYLAICEKQLADAYLELRLLPEALAMFDQAIAQFQALDLPDEQAWAMAQRGRTLAGLRPAQADAAFADAAGLFAAQGNAVGVAAVALARAESALQRAAQRRPVDAPDPYQTLDQALDWARQAAAGYAAADQAEGLARAELAQAEALLGQGQGQAARSLLQATLARTRVGQHLTVQVRCLGGLGRAALALAEPAAARLAFAEAIELFELQRDALPGDELRAAYLSDHLRPYQALLALDLADAGSDSASAAAVLQQLDRCRARSLDERLGESRIEGATSQATAPDPALVALRERLNWLYRRVQRLHDEASPATALQAELRQTEQTLLEHARRQRLTAPLARAGHDPAGLDLAGLHAALRPGDALVEFGAAGDELFACVVTPQRVSLVRQMASWAQVQDGIRGLRFQIDTLRHGSAALRRHLAQLTARAQARLRALHDQVWAPLAQAWGGAPPQRLLLVPHGLLGALPFAALDAGHGPIAHDCELALAPSARAALRGLLRPSAAARSVLALGESSRLPHAASEARAVAALFDSGQAWVAEEATLARLQAQAGQVDVLHLACHGQFRADNPRFSALHLADAALTVELAETLKLRPATVVLSACESGMAQIDDDSDAASGDEMVGLVRAFWVAGASRVLASQWPVDDAVTAAFMADFYRALRAGARPAKALQRAQMLTRQQHPHPHFWAAFSLFGGW